MKMHSVRGNLPSNSSPSRTYINSGYHHNLSGSDTDVSSTSNENLTIEERRVLQNGVRQEPQGEETVINDPDSISSNTLIIHEKIPGDHNSSFYGQNFKDPDNNMPMFQGTDYEKLEKYRLYENCNLMNLVTRNSPPVPLSPKSSRRQVLPGYHNNQVRSPWEQYSHHPVTEYAMVGRQTPIYSSPTQNHTVSPNYSEVQNVHGITEVPKDYLDQSEVLKYLAKELNHQNRVIEHYPPAQDYNLEFAKDPQIILGSAMRRRGYGMLGSKSKSAERLTVTRSHPDLSRAKHFHSEDNSAKMSLPVQRSDLHGRVCMEPDVNAAVQSA